MAYAADERRSTHPVAPLAEDVPDVDAAANNFDAISYAKGNSVLRQLVDLARRRRLPARASTPT